MAKLVSFKCDQCGRQKEESNHWFVFSADQDALHIYRFNTNSMLSPGVKHICGEACLAKTMSGHLARLSNGISVQG